MPQHPGTLRRRLKGAVRAAKRSRAVRTADVVFLSPGKSGRTWVRAMLSHVFATDCGTPPDRLVSRDRLHRLDPRIPRFFFSHGNPGEPWLVRRELRPGGFAGRTLVCLLRDPRDVTVSLFHQQQHRSKRPEAGFAAAEGTSDELLASTVAKVVERMNELAAIMTHHENAHRFHYEAFHADPTGELTRLLDVMGYATTAASIAAAVDFARFENLKKREAEGYFRADSLRPGDEGLTQSFKVRRGRVGGYRDELEPPQVALLDHLVALRLSPDLGYR